MEHELTIKIPFRSENHALLVRRVLEVDGELSPKAVQRRFDIQGEILVVSFSTSTVRLARLTLNSFLENLDLVTRTLGAFADDAAQQSHINDTITL